jgi:hypothetical protein
LIFTQPDNRRIFSSDPPHRSCVSIRACDFFQGDFDKGILLPGPELSGSLRSRVRYSYPLFMLRRDDPGAVWSQCQRVFCKSRSHQPSWSVGVGSFFPEGNLFRSEGLDIGFGRISFHNAHDVPGCANRATLSTSHCRHDLTRPAPLSMWSRMLHNAPALLASITEGISSTRNPGSPPNQLQILKPPPRSSAVEESGNCGSCGLQFQLLQPS